MTGASPLHAPTIEIMANTPFVFLRAGLCVIQKWYFFRCFQHYTSTSQGQRGMER